jgi:peptidoglycan hydrolase-like protein with peptidoglycan-binding domain
MSYLLDYNRWKRLNEATIAVNKLNGNMPDSGLVKIGVESGDAQGVHKLNAEAASDYEKMRASAKKDGVVWGITDSYRTYAVQDKIFDWDRFTRTGEKRKKATNIAAAYPGTSNHGYGSAIDLNLYGPGKNKSSEGASSNYQTIYNWLKSNANRFGFYELQGEPWHWDHKSSAEKYAKGAASYVPTQSTSVSKLYVESNPLLSKKLERFEKGDLVLDNNANSAEDVILLISNYLPKEYKSSLTLDGTYGAALVSAISKFQKDRNLPRQDGKIDIATYNEIFKDVVAKPSRPGARDIADLGGYVIVKGLDSNDFALIYGGTPSKDWGAKRMFQLLDGILAGFGKNVIYSNNENPISSVESTLKSKYPDAKVVSVSGFSGGGPKTLEAMTSNKYKFIGLIDPFIRKPLLNLPQNTKIMYNAGNWGGIPAFNEVNKMMTAMQSTGSEEVKGGAVNLRHDKIPAEFFTKYGKLI